MTDNVLAFPQLTEIDRQFVELETQRDEIDRQRKLIEEQADATLNGNNNSLHSDT